MSDLKKAVGRFKRAAIDAYMRQVDRAAWRPDGAVYQDRSSMDTTVTRPGEDGEGGGHKHYTLLFWGVDNNDYVAVFNEIRGRVDTIVADWFKDLPTESSFRTLANTATDQCSGIAVTGTAVGPYMVTVGDIAVSVKNAENYAANLRGEMSVAFRDKFLYKVEGTLSNIAAACMIRIGAFEGQRAIWEKVDRTAAAAVNAAAESMEAVAEGTSAAATFLNEIFGVVIGKAGGIFSAAESVFGAASDFAQAGKETVVVTATSFDDGFTKLDDALKAVSEQIKLEEKAVEAQLKHAYTSMRSNRAAFDLPAPTDRDMTEAEAIALDEESVLEICDKHLPAIAGFVATQRSAVFNTSMTNAAERPSTIGMGTYGPTTAYANLNTQVWKLMFELEEDCENGARLLKLAWQEALTHEASIIAELQQFLVQLDQDEARQPW